MKIHLINNSQQQLGGGFTFVRTFDKYLRRAGIDVVDSAADADVIFISSATMTDRSVIQDLKAMGKKIVFRIDNIPRNSRNRNTGTSRLYDFAQMADLVIYQSEWAKSYVGNFLANVDKSHGPVILNGADTDVFKPEGPTKPNDGTPQYLYARFNRDETKNFHVAWYDYILLQRFHSDAHLWLVGQFSPENIAYNFDFFQNEKFEYLGVIDEPDRMAEIYRGAHILMIPYFNDACSQTLIEARNCGMTRFEFGIGNNIGMSGGTPEIMKAPIEYLKADYMTQRYVEEIKKL